jgi:hypothetical protein
MRRIPNQLLGTRQHHKEQYTVRQHPTNVQPERLLRHHHHYSATKITAAIDIQDPTGTVTEVMMEIREAGDLEAETREVVDMVEEAVDGSLAVEDTDHQEDLEDMVAGGTIAVADGTLEEEDQAHQVDHHLHLGQEPTTLTPESPHSYANLT